MISEKNATYYVHSNVPIAQNILENELGKVHSYQISNNKRFMQGYKLSGGKV